MKKLIAFALSLCLLLSMSSAFAESLTVNGSGVVNAQPDYVRVSLGVTAYAETVCEAQKNVNEVIATVREAVLEGGVEEADILLDSISVYAEYDYSEEVAMISGYTASHQLDVRIRDIDNAGSVIDAALAAGANSIYGLSFGVSDENEYYQEALVAALQSASEKAQFIATNSGVTLGGIEDIIENSDSAYEAESGLTSMATMENVSGATELETGVCTITASVTVKYEIE